MSNGQLTRQGFLTMTQMEAEDNEGREDELWVNLESLGYNKSLFMDEASPFSIEVYADKCSTTLKVLKVDAGGKSLTNALIRTVIAKGVESRVKGSKDLLLHVYATDYRVCLVVENQSSGKLGVSIDCRNSQNVGSNNASLASTADVPSKSALVLHHLLPIKESQGWTVYCQDAPAK